MTRDDDAFEARVQARAEVLRRRRAEQPDRAGVPDEQIDRYARLFLTSEDRRAAIKLGRSSLYCSGSSGYWERAAEDYVPPTFPRCHRTPAELGADMPVRQKNSRYVYTGTPPRHLKPDSDMTEVHRQTLAEVAKARAALHRRIRAAERADSALHEATEGRLSLAVISYGRHPVSWEQAHKEADQFAEGMLRDHG
jgi:hypothetical protein